MGSMRQPGSGVTLTVPRGVRLTVPKLTSTPGPPGVTGVPFTAVTAASGMASLSRTGKRAARWAWTTKASSRAAPAPASTAGGSGVSPAAWTRTVTVPSSRAPSGPVAV
jgi:hypothetical protein